MMTLNLGWWTGLWNEMIDNDTDRNKLYEGIDDMFHNDWDLPEELSNIRWVHKVISSDPRDALMTATRVLSTVRPKLTYQPLAPGPDNLANATIIERALLWHWDNASRRPKSRPTRNITHSAVRYDMVPLQVVYLPYQFKALAAINSTSRRAKAAMRYGPFAIVVHNAKDVHAISSEYMLEQVLLSKVMKANEFVAYWGDRAKEIKEKMEDEALQYITVLDYMDYDRRVVYASLQDHTSLEIVPTGGVVIVDEKHDLPFLPWVVKDGGLTIESDSDKSVMPMLQTIYQTKQWDTVNIVRTLTASETIAYAAAPRGKKRGPAPEEINVDYGEPGRNVELQPGEDYEQLSPPQIDRALTEINDRETAAMNKSTVAQLLQNIDLPSGLAFATINAALQTATSALDPAKEVAEAAHAEAFRHMLEWLDYTGDTLIAYDNREGVPRGTQIAIRGGDEPDFDVENLYLSVKLTAHIPTDQVQRINAAVMLVERLKMSTARALEMVDVTDPDQVIEEWQQEQIDQFIMQMRLQAIAQQQAMAQQQQMAMAQGMQWLAQQQAQPGAGPAFDNAQGETGFNPAQMGTSPATLAPGLTREAISGTDRSGNALAEGL
jgi:hypothetical protein